MAARDIEQESPYLSGPYAPVLQEVTATDLPVEGELPDDLEGVFVRTGSNPRFAPKGRYHWFDGDGMLHGLELGGGTATYRNRWVRTAGFEAEDEAGEALWSGIRERPDFGRRGGVFKNTANTDVVFHHGRLLALWWLGGAPYAVRLPELETIGVDEVPGSPASIAAHPKADPRTGELVWFDFGAVPPYLSYGVLAADGGSVHRAFVDLDGPRLQHDLAITEHHTVLFDMALHWDLQAFARGSTIGLRMEREEPSRIGVVPRRGSVVRWFDVAPMFTYHTVNAWEEVSPAGHDLVVVLGCRIADPLVGDAANPEGAGNPPPVPSIANLRLEPRLHRWELDLTTGATREEQLDDRLVESPSVDARLLGMPTSAAYLPTLVADRPEVAYDGLVRYDTGPGAAPGGDDTYRYEPGWLGGEAAFAPRRGSQDDQDGYVLTFAADEASGESALLVFDAGRLADGPVARVRLPERVPAGFHACWVPADQLTGPVDDPSG
jgi:carotenoid cleavage dioxygenase-like enzyme